MNTDGWRRMHASMLDSNAFWGAVFNEASTGMVDLEVDELIG
jgi:hypothetical protein